VPGQGRHRPGRRRRQGPGPLRRLADRVPGRRPGPGRAAARDSIGKALEGARTLPAAPARAVTALARHSFIVSMRLAYGIAAGVVLTAAFIAWRFLPARAPADPLPDEGLTPAELVAGDG